MAAAMDLPHDEDTRKTYHKTLNTRIMEAERCRMRGKNRRILVTFPDGKVICYSIKFKVTSV